MVAFNLTVELEIFDAECVHDLKEESRREAAPGNLVGDVALGVLDANFRQLSA